MIRSPNRPVRSRRAALLTALVAAGVLGPLGGVSANAQPLRGVGRADPELRFSIAPRVAYIGPAGAVEIQGSNRIPTEFMRIDEVRVRPAWAATARKGRWAVDATGFSSRTAGTGEQPGSQIPQFGFRNAPSRTEFQLDVAEVRLARVVLERAFDPDDTGTPVVGIRLEPRVGARLIDFRTSVESLAPGGPRVEGSTTLIEPTIGIRGAMTFGDRFTMDLGVDIGGLPDLGGGTNSSSGSIEYVFRYHATQHLDVEAGYRLLIQDLEDEGEVLLDGSVAGIFFGVVYRM